MSARPAAQLDTMMQPQKHAAVTAGVQPAAVVVVRMQSLANLDDIVCRRLPSTALYIKHFCMLPVL